MGDSEWFHTARAAARPVPIISRREACSSSMEDDLRLEARTTTVFFEAGDLRRRVLNLCSVRPSEDETAEDMMTWMMRNYLTSGLRGVRSISLASEGRVISARDVEVQRCDVQRRCAWWSDSGAVSRLDNELRNNNPQSRLSYPEAGAGAATPGATLPGAAK